MTAHQAGDPLRVWIDLSNSPHPILFEPVVEELRAAGHEVVITARDHAQTVDLARQRWPEVHVVGGGSPRGPAGKVRTLARRARELARFARSRRVEVAVSHNSYAQAAAARLARVRCVTAMDYEHQPANHVAFRLAHRVLVPADFPSSELRRQGATARKVWRYDGFKEEVYLHRFSPDRGVLDELGLDAGEPFIVARPSPEGATYHQFGNPMFEAAIEQVIVSGDARVVLLPRRPEDVRPYERLAGDRLIVPDRAIDTRSLLFHASALVGAGGTMNREAALLGTPVFSLYAGRGAALDRRLVREGKLRLVGEEGSAELARDLRRLVTDPAPREAPSLTSAVLDRFVEAIVTPLGERPSARAPRAVVARAG